MAASDVSPSFAADRDTGIVAAPSLAGESASGAIQRAVIEQVGRALAILLPLVTAAVLSGWSEPRTMALAFGAGGVWFACVNASFSSSRTTLFALGPRVAVVRGALLGLVATTALGVWLPGLSFGIGTSLAVAAVILLLVSGWETVVVRSLTPATRLLVVGPRDPCTELIRELNASHETRFRLVGVVDDAQDAQNRGALVLGTTAELRRIVTEVKPDLVALAPGCNRPETFTQLLESAASGFRVLELAQFYEHAFGRVPVRDLTRAWFMSVLHLYQRPYARYTKRTSDIAGALILLTIAVPLFPILALLVRCTRGPVLLRQTRVGEHGELFMMYKFRTMRVDAEAPGVAVWATRDDPRVTSIGKIMRRFRLDELPQIWNVLIGDMSIVGPRPERPEFIDQLLESVPFWARRHLVKPGITGWAQVKRGYTADTKGSLEKLSYDLWYIRHRSLTTDAVICARTLAAILRGEPYPRAKKVPEEFDPVATLVHHGPPTLVEADQV